MIVDRIQNAALYLKLHERFQVAFDFLQQADIADLEVGEHLIQGREVFASVAAYQTRPVEDGHHEAHRKYIDLQFIVQGNERFGYAPVTGQDVVEKYCAERDVAFYNVANPSFITLSSNMFAIFFPDDAHKPCCCLEAPSSVKKIVVKIAI